MSAQWTILKGTGELANLRGQGLSYTDDTYDGQVHFDPRVLNGE